MSDKPSMTLEKTIFLKVVRDYVMRPLSVYPNKSL